MARRQIIGFDRDEEGHWRAVLDCGHRQHVRHQPPLVSRPWVLTAAGRASQIGHPLECVLCSGGSAAGPSSDVPGGEAGGDAS